MGFPAFRLLTAGLVAIAYPAAAQDTPRLALFDVSTLEAAPAPALAAAATASLRRELRRYESFQVLDSLATAAMAAMHATAGRCADSECVRLAGQMLGARWAAWTELSNPAGQGWRLTTSVMALPAGTLLLAERKVQLGEASREAVVRGSQYLAQRIAEALGAAPLPPLDTAEVAGAKLDADEVRRRLAAGGAGLAGADLSGLDLRGVDFRRADLTRTRLARANLAGANLFSCDLTDAVLAGADLSGANLDGATLRRADFRQAVLRKASLFATILEEADLSEADLRETRIIGYLRKAKLTGARLERANIGADPGNQSMGVMRAQFVSADLSGADLTGANLYKADFSYARLVGARLVGAELSHTELVSADLTDADLTGATLAHADLSGTVFTGAKGLDQVKDLGQAKHRDKAVFGPAP